MIRVVDKQTEQPLFNANVIVSNRLQSTDINGYTSEIACLYTDSITISYLGYLTITMGCAGISDTLICGLEQQEGLLNTITVSASRNSENNFQSTASIAVLKPQFLEQTNTVSIEQSIGRLGGVDFVGNQVSIRGGNGYSFGAGSRALLVVDGIPALQPDAGAPFWNDYPIELISQLEVLKGASSALYGSAALNGLIHITTREAQKNPYTKFTTSIRQILAPSDKTKQWWDSAPTRVHFGAAHTRKLGKTSLAASTYFVDEQSHIEPNTEQYGRVYTKISRFFGVRHKVGLLGSWNKGRANEALFWLNDSSGIYQSSQDGDIQSRRQRWVISPSYSYIANDHSIDFKGQYLRNDNPGNENRSIRSDMWYTDVQYNKLLKDLGGRFTLGSSYLYATALAELYQNADISSDNFSIYSQFQATLDQLQLNAGVRYENFSLSAPDSLNSTNTENSDDRFVGRFGLSYSLTPATVLRSSWGQGFRFPAIAERYISTNIGATIISPNPDLKPETGNTFEFGIKQLWRVGNWKGIFDIAGFYARYNDMIEFVFTGFVRGFQSQNIGNTEISGVDMNMGFERKSKNLEVQGFLAYQYLNPRYRDFTEDIRRQATSDRNFLKYRSKHVVKGDIQCTMGKWSIGTNYQYNSGVESIDAVFELLVPGLVNYRMNDLNFHLWQLRFSRKIAQDFNLTLILDNALNESYSLRPGVEESPRSISLRLETEL